MPHFSEKTLQCLLVMMTLLPVQGLAQTVQNEQSRISTLRAMKNPEARVIEIDRIFSSQETEVDSRTDLHVLAELRSQSCLAAGSNCENKMGWLKRLASAKTWNDNLTAWLQQLARSLNAKGLENFRLEAEKINLEDAQLGLKAKLLFQYSVDSRARSTKSKGETAPIIQHDEKVQPDAATALFLKQLASHISTPYSTRVVATKTLARSLKSKFKPELTTDQDLLIWVMSSFMLNLNLPDQVLLTYNDLKTGVEKMPQAPKTIVTDVFCIASRVTLNVRGCVEEMDRLSLTNSSTKITRALDTMNLAEVESLLKSERLIPFNSEMSAGKDPWLFYLTSQFYRLKKDYKTSALYIETFKRYGGDDPFVSTFYEIETARIFRLQNKIADATYHLALAKRLTNQVWGPESFIALLLNLEILKNLSITGKSQEALRLRTEILAQIAGNPSLSLYREVIALIDKMSASKSKVSSPRQHPDLIDVEMISQILVR